MTTEFNPPEYPPEEDLTFPLWAEVEHLSADAFQGHGELMMRLISRCL